MQAYKQKKAYIIAEGPMSSTVRNMWKVICDRKCGAVIMLSDLIENGMVCIVKTFHKMHVVLTGVCLYGGGKGAGRGGNCLTVSCLRLMFLAVIVTTFLE